MKPIKLAPIFILGLLSLQACNMPVAHEQVPPPDDVQTAAALTVQAVINTPSPTKVLSSASKTPSPTSSPTPTMTITPTYSVPMLAVQGSTNCRKGPGEEYEIVLTYVSGKKLEVVGRYVPGDFWLVKSGVRSADTCWLQGEYVEVTGSYWAVASVTPPPTASPAPPRAPSIDKWEYSCNSGKLTFTVTWTDKENGETGYRIFRDGEPLVELPANSTSYNDTFILSLGESPVYYLQVYGPAGSANSYMMETNCWESD